MARHGKKKGKPSHMRYVTHDQRTVNKMRRVARFNGVKFLTQWKLAHGIK
jgi:hypothetical protein